MWSETGVFQVSETPELLHPALAALHRLEQRHPNVWSVADNLQNHFKRWQHREGSVFSLAEAELVSKKIQGEGDAPFSPALIGALVAWRPTKSIYRFHPALYEALVETDLEGDVPSDVLLRMPSWAVYIETPPSENMPFPTLGFWAYLSRLGKQNELELVGLWRPGADFQDASIDHERDVLAFSLPLGNHPVADLTRMMFDGFEQDHDPSQNRNGRENANAIINHVVSAMLSLLLYLCSEEPDINDWEPLKPKAKFFGTTRRWIVAKDVRQWEVGIRLGAALDPSSREIRGNSTNDPGMGSSPRPHIRRAHWHSYWIGKRGGQTVSLRWLPPIPVNTIDDTALPAVIHPVIG